MSIISLTYKNIYFQLAMLSFLSTYFLSNKLYIHIGLILAYLFLFIWEYDFTKTITIDIVVWTTLFIGINIYKIVKKVDESNRPSVSS